jgi:hypothetical protein
MERIRQILRVIFRVGFVCDVDVAPLVEIESDQDPLSALFLRRHPRDVIVAAVILEHDHFPDMEQCRVDVAIRVDSETLRRVRELGHDPGLELGRCWRRSGGEKPGAGD